MMMKYHTHRIVDIGNMLKLKRYKPEYMASRIGLVNRYINYALVQRRY